MKLSRFVVGGMFGVMMFAGCDCGAKKGGGQFGEVGIIYDQDGVTITGPNGNYAFGKVGMGTSPTMKVVIQNRGLVTLDLESVEKDMGEALKVGEFISEPAPVFELAFTKTTLG